MITTITYSHRSLVISLTFLQSQKTDQKIASHQPFIFSGGRFQSQGQGQGPGTGTGEGTGQGQGQGQG